LLDKSTEIKTCILAEGISEVESPAKFDKVFTVDLEEIERQATLAPVFFPLKFFSRACGSRRERRVPCPGDLEKQSNGGPRYTEPYGE